MPTGPAPSSKQTLQTIWLAMISAIPCYWFVWATTGNRPVQPEMQLFSIVLAFLSGATYLAAAGWVRWRLLPLEKQVTPTALQQLTPEQRAMLGQQAQASVIVTLALLETPVVFGLINAFVGGPIRLLFVCNAVFSALLMVRVRLQILPLALKVLD